MSNKPVFYLMAYLFFAYSVMTIIVGYMPVYFTYQGLSEREIGYLLAIGPFAAIFAQPFWGYMSDKYKSMKRILIITVIGTMISLFVLFQIKQFIGFMFLMFILFLFMAPTTALGDSLSQKTAIFRSVSFGRIRMWGSLGFAITSLLSGFLFSYLGIGYMVYPAIFVAMITLLFAFLVEDVSTTTKPVTLFHALKAGVEPKLLLFLFLIMLISIPHRANDSYLGIFITYLDGSEAYIGWAWFIGVVSEAVVFATAPYWMQRFQPLSFIIFAAIIYTVRWVLMSFVSEATMVLWLQTLHGMSFAIFYISAFQFTSKLFPEELKATGHVLFITAFFAISGIIGALLGGYVMEVAGANLLYLYLGYLSLAGVIGLTIYSLLNKRLFRV